MNALDCRDETRTEDVLVSMAFHAAVLAQLARGLLNNEAYRACANPECGRLFTPKEMGRRLDTKYCCSECQERAKRLRYVAKHS